MYRIGILLSIISSIATAEIYKWKDASGTMHYSDTAPKDRPTLAPTNIVIPTPIQATKIAPKKTEQTGPRVIEIGDQTTSIACTTKGNGGMPDQIQTWLWKDCRGMR